MKLQSSETISKLTNELKLMKENYKKLESDISVCETVNSLLSNKMSNVERHCWGNTQYSRRKCLEIVEMPSSVNINDFEGKVCTIFNRIGFDVKPDDIEA